MTKDVNGDVWFVLADVCRVLELTTPARVAERLDEADVSSTHIRSNGQNRAVTIVNESGLYDVVLDSRKPQAKKFRRWITTEVVPSIRKTALGTEGVENCGRSDLSGRGCVWTTAVARTFFVMSETLIGVLVGAIVTLIAGPGTALVTGFIQRRHEIKRETLQSYQEQLDVIQNLLAQLNDERKKFVDDALRLVAPRRLLEGLDPEEERMYDLDDSWINFYRSSRNLLSQASFKITHEQLRRDLGTFRSKWNAVVEDMKPEINNLPQYYPKNVARLNHLHLEENINQLEARAQLLLIDDASVGFIRRWWRESKRQRQVATQKPVPEIEAEPGPNDPAELSGEDRNTP